MSNFSKLIDRFDRLFLYYLSKAVLRLVKPRRKFYTDMIYGILKGQSIILSDVAHALNEGITPRKSIQRLSEHLDSNFNLEFREGMLSLALSMMPRCGLNGQSHFRRPLSVPFLHMGISHFGHDRPSYVVQHPVREGF